MALKKGSLNQIPRSAWIGVVLFVVVLFALGVFFTTAKAGETVIYGGAELAKNNIFCQANGTSGEWEFSSNGGIRQEIFRPRENVLIMGNYTHHSCAFKLDQNGYDALGIMFEWRIK